MVRKLIKQIVSWFTDDYIPKFIEGQREHGGNLTDMGLKQAQRNAKQEVMDLVSYLYVGEDLVRKIEEIAHKVPTGELTADTAIAKIIHLIAREKTE